MGDWDVVSEQPVSASTSSSSSSDPWAVVDEKPITPPKPRRNILSMLNAPPQRVQGIENEPWAAQPSPTPRPTAPIPIFDGENMQSFRPSQRVKELDQTPKLPGLGDIAIGAKRGAQAAFGMMTGPAAILDPQVRNISQEGISRLEPSPEELAGRRGFGNRAVQDITSGLTQLPAYSFYTAAGGPVLGMAGASMASAAQGSDNTSDILKAGGEGAVLGAALHATGGSSLPVRAGANAAVMGGMSALKGGSPDENLSAAVTGGALGAIGPFRKAPEAPRLPYSVERFANRPEGMVMEDGIPRRQPPQPVDANAVVAGETIPGHTAEDSARVFAREFPPPYYPARDAADALSLVDNPGPPVTPPGIDMTTGKSARESAEAIASGIPPLPQDLHPRTGNPLNNVQPGDYLPDYADQRGGKSAADTASIMSPTFQGDGGRHTGADTMDWLGNDVEIPRRIKPAPEGEARFNSAEDAARVFENNPPEEPPPPPPTGPLAEPDYESPKPPEPTPLEEPKTPPVMQEPQPEAPPPPPVEPVDPNAELDQISQRIAGAPFADLPPDLQGDIRVAMADPKLKEELMLRAPEAETPPAPEPPPAPTQAPITPSKPSELPPRRPFSQRGAATPDFLNPTWIAKDLPKAAADTYDKVYDRVAKSAPGKFIRGLAQAVAPTAVANRRTVDEFFNAKGEQQWQNTLYDRAMKGMHTHLESLSKLDQVAFIDRMMKGDTQPTSDLQAIASFIRDTTDSLFTSASKYSNILNYLDNYGVQLAWKTPPKSPNFDPQGRPVSTPQGGTMEGNKSFLKHRFWQSLSAGMAHGGEPISTNALDLLGLQVDSVSKFVTANRFWDGLKKLDQVQWVKSGDPMPEGSVRWNDPLAKQRQGSGAIGDTGPKGEAKDKGYWAVDQGAAKLLQNYLSRDALRDIRGTEPGSSERAVANIGRSIMFIKNFHTSWELGFSGFHAMFEAAEAQGAVMGLGVRKLLNAGPGWDPVGGLKDLGESLVPGMPADRTFALGKAARKFIDLNARDLQLDKIKSVDELAQNPLYSKMFKQYPDALNLMHDYFLGGGTFTLHKDYQMGMQAKIDKATKEMTDDPSVSAYLKTLGLTAAGLPEMISYPLFHVYIPNLKMGLFMREYAQNLREQSDRIDQGLTTRQEVATRTRAFVEDRLGEMNFDNLVWNKTFKTMMQMGFRSVTWKLGSIRALAKAPLTQAREFKQAAQEQRMPNITPEAAWLIGMGATTALFGGAAHWMMTGHPPQTKYDVMFPQYDDTDETSRFAYPSYAKEFLHMKHDPIGYLKSGMAGMWSKYAEAIGNRDFTGTQVRDPNASPLTQAGQTLEHIFPLPISVSSRNRAAREGGTPAEQVGAFIGMPRAPRYAFEDPGTQKLRELMHEQTGETQTKTKSEFQRRQYMKGLERAYRGGREDQVADLATDGLNRGIISKDDADRALTLGDKNATPDARFLNSAKELKLENMFDLWPELNDHQKELVHDVIVEKFEKAADSKPEQTMIDLARHAKRKGFQF